MSPLHCRSALLLLAAMLTAPLSAADMFVYFGTHRAGPGIGFSLAHFDTDTGVLTTPQFLLEAREPAFFTIDRTGRRLYTCNSGAPGLISAYAIDPATARLILLNQVSSGGVDPSYVCLDHTGRFVLTANYEGGNIAAFALLPDGRIGERTALAQHTGRSVNPKRQTHAYAHSIIVDPTNRFVLTGCMSTASTRPPAPLCRTIRPSPRSLPARGRGT
jgi:6-phosphogluconolactonase